MFWIQVTHEYYIKERRLERGKAGGKGLPQEAADEGKEGLGAMVPLGGALEAGLEDLAGRGGEVGKPALEFGDAP